MREGAAEEMGDRDFPKHFVWGAATCPACCEGETVSDWAKLSAPDGSVPDDGPRHWRRYRYDFRAMADLGLGAYRFGLDWGRLQRAPYGDLSREDTFRYLEMLAELRGLGIEPWLTLFHNALPRWASRAGGRLNPEAPYWFADFARRLADVTDGEVGHWLTVHEPQMYALACYAWGAFPGGAWGRLDQARKALSALKKAHRLAAAAVRKRLPGARVGLSLPGGCFFPGRAWHPGDWLAAVASDWLLNNFGMRGFMSGDGACDFLMIGVGNELPVRAGDSLSLSAGVARQVHARMLHEGGGNVASGRRRKRLSAWLRKHRLPVYLVGAVPDAEQGGLDELLSAYAGMAGPGAASGFFYEPLLDQFDVHRGLTAGHGLLRVDFHGQERRRDIRQFARRFGRVARTGRLRETGGRDNGGAKG